MEDDLKTLLTAADELTTRINLALKYLSNASASTENLDLWETNISKWQKEVTALRRKIFSAIKNQPHL